MAKTILVLIRCVIALAFFDAARTAFAFDEVAPEVQEQADKYQTVRLKLDCLTKIINTEDGLSPASNFRKSSAITLAGRIGGTNVISLLVSNLAFIDSRYNVSPASRILQRIGKPSVQSLLEVLNEVPDPLRQGSSEEQEVVWAATTIGFIEQDEWFKFLERQKRVLSARALERLQKYAVIFST